jgi:hypothetical protein
VERTIGQSQVDGDDAIVVLACGAAVLVLNSGGLVALLGTTSLVKNTDDSRATVLGGDSLLQLIPHPKMVPLGQAQELLQGFGSHLGGQGYGLNALSVEVRELALYINVQVMSCLLIHEATVEESEELLNSWAQG